MRKNVALLVAMVALLLGSPAHAGPFVVPVPAGERISIEDPGLSARSILATYAPVPYGVELSLAGASAGPEVTLFRFRQVHLGVPVFARGAAVAADETGRVLLATARVEPRLPDSVVPAVDAADAARIAAQRVRLDAGPQHARLAIWPDAAGGRLAWIVAPPSLLPIPYAPVVVVDATDGRVLYVENAVKFKNLANVYQFNPVKTPNLIQVTLPITDPNTTPDNDDVKSFNCADTKKVKQVTVPGVPIPITVHVCELLKNAVADGTTGDYTQYPSMTGAEPSRGEDDPFGEVQVFYYVNQALDFYRAFDPNFKLVAEAQPLFVIANLMLPDGINYSDPLSSDLNKMADPNVPFVPLLNAMYTGWDPQYAAILSTLFPDITGASIFCGQGQLSDWGYDGDVIFHEFGHAMVNATINLIGGWHLDAQGATAAPGSMNEGLADYFSAAMTGDGDTGEYAARDIGATAIRHLDGNTRTCPDWLTGEVHADSEFFSSAIWTTRQGLPEGDRRTFDGVIFKTLQGAASGDVGYDELASAFVEAVKNSALGQSAADSLTTTFEAKGLLPSCHRVLTWTGTPIKSKDAHLGYTFAAPGKADAIGGGGLDYMMGLFQVEVPLEPATVTLTMTFTETGGVGISLPGQGGTAFTPAFLVKFDGEIAFDPQNNYAANTTTVVDAATNAQSDYEGKVGVPGGAQTAHVMVVNKGDTGSGFTNLAFAFKTGVVVDGGTDSGADSGATTDTGAQDTGTPDAGVSPDSGSQVCACDITYACDENCACDPDCAPVDAGHPTADTGTPAVDTGSTGEADSSAEAASSGEGGCSCAVIGL